MIQCTILFFLCVLYHFIFFTSNVLSIENLHEEAIANISSKLIVFSYPVADKILQKIHVDTDKIMIETFFNILGCVLKHRWDSTNTDKKSGKVLYLKVDYLNENCNFTHVNRNKFS